MSEMIWEMTFDPPYLCLTSLVAVQSARIRRDSEGGGTRGPWSPPLLALHSSPYHSPLHRLHPLVCGLHSCHHLVSGQFTRWVETRFFQGNIISVVSVKSPAVGEAEGTIFHVSSVLLYNRHARRPWPRKTLFETLVHTTWILPNSRCVLYLNVFDAILPRIGRMHLHAPDAWG